MTAIILWAPDAESVEIDVTTAEWTGTAPMERVGGGTWRWSPAEMPAGDLDYAFRVDGSDPMPDPRSAWQPEGVHGPSRWFDTGAHEWQDSQWRGVPGGEGSLGAVVYELHIGTFTDEGTLDSATERLPYLVELGVDIVELMPVAAFAGRWGWGYDGVLPYAVHAAYGGPAALQRFVDAAHGLGLGVCLDVVYNHLGPTGNYLGRFGPYFTDKHDTPWGPAVNLDDAGAEGVRAWIIDNALRWLGDFHIDALRIDAVHELRDDSERHILAELSDRVAELSAEVGRPLSLIAESDLNDPMMVTPTDEGGRGMTAQWDDDIHHALHVALTGETHGYYSDFSGMDVLAHVLTDVFVHNGRWSAFREQEWGAPVDRERYDGRRFLAYLQTHDQVGNRATGDRITEALVPGQQAIGAALYLCSAFTPMIFMGEEWAASTPFQFFTDFDEDWLAEAVREGRRAEFAHHGWEKEQVPDPQDRETHQRSTLDWRELHSGEHARMLAWYRALIALRRAEPVLSSGDLTAVRTSYDMDHGWLVMHRGEHLHVVCNLAQDERVVPVPGANEIVAAFDPGETSIAAGRVTLPAHGVAIVRS
ncbi:malto-oligosyltrehalose trehalohydrolase [Actinomycetota bacterium]